MSDEERPLPKPPSTPFGRKRFREEESSGPLMSDRIMAAMAEGRLEEFLKTEVPDNEHARRLVSLMMGMTGMAPFQGMPSGAPQERSDEPAGETPQEAGQPPSAETVPEEVMKAVQSGDVQGLMGMLMREHQKRAGGAPEPEPEKEMPRTAELPVMEKEILDRLMKIASDNSLSLDWLIMRALRLYIEEHEKTGRL